MSDANFDILRCVEEILLIVLTAYILPWVRQKVASSKLEMLVHAAQAMYGAKPGPERREIVLQWYKASALSKVLHLTDEQVRILLEEAYNKMVIAKGV